MSPRYNNNKNLGSYVVVEGLSCNLTNTCSKMEDDPTTYKEPVVDVNAANEKRS